MAGPGHSGSCPAVYILKETQQGQYRYGAETADAHWGVLNGVHIGGTRRIRLNCPRAVAMRPYVLTTSIWAARSTTHMRPMLHGVVYTSCKCPHNMANFGPLTADIRSGVWGTPANFNGFRVLTSLLRGILAVGVSQTLRR